MPKALAGSAGSSCRKSLSKKYIAQVTVRRRVVVRATPGGHGEMNVYGLARKVDEVAADRRRQSRPAGRDRRPEDDGSVLVERQRLLAQPYDDGQRARARGLSSPSPATRSAGASGSAASEWREFAPRPVRRRTRYSVMTKSKACMAVSPEPTMVAGEGKSRRPPMKPEGPLSSVHTLAAPRCYDIAKARYDGKHRSVPSRP